MSAVIYAAIVVMWAVVLVPMWLRRHDTTTESRSVDRFSTAMRILSRRSAPGPDRRYVVMPRREGAMSVHVSGASAPATGSRPARPSAPGRPARPQRPTVATTSIVVRRRRVFLGLLALSLLTFLLAVGGVVSWLLQIVVDLVLIAFVVHLRAQARRAVAVSRQRRRATAAPASAVSRPPTSAPASARAGSASTVGGWLFDDRVDEATGTDDALPTWQPIPVPPPTYTLKPPAPSFPAETPAAQVGPSEPFDQDAPFDQEAMAARDAVAVDDRSTELDEILEHRWAVND